MNKDLETIDLTENIKKKYTLKDKVFFGFCGLSLFGVLMFFLFKDDILPEESAYSKGRKVAESAGCFACHGRTDTTTAYNLEKLIRKDKDDEDYETQSVSWFFSDYKVRTPQRYRQWIENGLPENKRNDKEDLEEHENHALKMPAYKKSLSKEEIDNLIVFLTIDNRGYLEKTDKLFSKGEKLARKAGCFACHGELGQGGINNLGSFKGYIPGFFGKDFEILTDGAKEQEIKEWIRDGVSKKFYNQNILGFKPGKMFTEKQSIQMPAYKEYLTEEEIDTLVQYTLELHKKGQITYKDLDQFKTQKKKKSKK